MVEKELNLEAGTQDSWTGFIPDHLSQAVTSAPLGFIFSSVKISGLGHNNP